MPCIPSYQSFFIPSSGLTIGHGHMRDNSRETQQKPKKSIAKKQKKKEKKNANKRFILTKPKSSLATSVVLHSTAFTIAKVSQVSSSMAEATKKYFASSFMVFSQ